MSTINLDQFKSISDQCAQSTFRSNSYQFAHCENNSIWNSQRTLKATQSNSKRLNATQSNLKWLKATQSDSTQLKKTLIKADSLYKYNSTKAFDSKTELYWDEMEQIWFCKKVGKLGIEYLPLWKNFSILYHIHGILNLVLAGNSNVVEITKESCNYTKNLPLHNLMVKDFKGILNLVLHRDSIRLKNPPMNFNE